MKTLSKTLALDAQFIHLYRPLVRNLVLIIGAVIIMGAAALLYFDHKLVRTLSEGLIQKSAHATDQQLNHLFDGSTMALRIAQLQVESLEISPGESEERLFEALQPFLANVEFLDSINLADFSGNEYALIKQGEEILTRFVDSNAPGVAQWRRRVDQEINEKWTRQIDFSPVDRPWFQGAAKLENGSRFWTAPYTFATTKEPGISVSSKAQRPGSDELFIIAFNLTLTNITHYTTRLRPSDSGMTVVFDHEGKVIGLPPHPRFDDEKSVLSAVLSPVAELGISPLESALEHWEASSRQPGISPFTAKDRANWWSGFSSIELGPDKIFWSATLIPEADFLGSVGRMRNLSLAGIGLVGLLVGAGVFLTSMKSIRRQMRTAVDLVERKLGQYQLQQKIGEGGNGAVYRARHALLRRPTAIKLMSPEFSRSDAARSRFEHEVQITSGLSHPNTIAIYDYGQTPDGTLYYAMEYLSGVTLDALAPISGPLPAGRVIHILMQVAGSLAEAHEQGLIHRDIKPSNVIICERGGLYDVVKVLDFGLVKEIAQTDGNLTQANVLIGTPLYMAPETISRPGQASPASDLYALGAVGYFLLTGRNVFEGASAVEICARHLNDVPVPPSERAGLTIPPDLEAIILSCLEKDPTLRPPDAASLQASLLDCRDARSWSQNNAREWWQGHSGALSEDSPPRKTPPLSNTELLVDLDDRMMSTGSPAER
jgi:serine/threonine-protein kinase